MNAFQLNLLLTIINGAWTISLGAFIIFLVFHLFQRGVDWRDWFFDAPVGAQVAVAILVADLGNWIVRTAVWVWRETGQETIPNWLVGWIIAGAFIGSVGIFCKLRVFSVPWFGHGPWLVTLIVTAAFILVRALSV